MAGLSLGSIADLTGPPRLPARRRMVMLGETLGA